MIINWHYDSYRMIVMILLAILVCFGGGGLQRLGECGISEASVDIVEHDLSASIKRVCSSLKII